MSSQMKSRWWRGEKITVYELRTNKQTNKQTNFFVKKVSNISHSASGKNTIKNIEKKVGVKIPMKKLRTLFFDSLNYFERISL